MLSDPVAEAFGLIHRHPSGENFFDGLERFLGFKNFTFGVILSVDIEDSVNGSLPISALLTWKSFLAVWAREKLSSLSPL